MKDLVEYKEEIHSCSKCGLCQSVCPVYKVTGNDCTVSRGLFIMLRGLINKNLKMSTKLNHYLDLCLKCGACTKFCPSEINVVDIITAAKSEYFRTHPIEKLISFIQKNFIFGLGVKVLSVFARNISSKKYDKKVIYFGGCSGILKGNKAVVKLLNNCNIEVVTPNFSCCGIPFYVRGDFETFAASKQNFADKIKQFQIDEIVTTCASCEKTIKEFSDTIVVRNIFRYLREKNLRLKLKKPVRVTFHKPCNLDNFEDIRWILENTENLEYTEMKDFDECCGLNGITKFKEYSILSKIFIKKHNNIKNSGSKIVLTSCLGCEVALRLYSFGKYKVQDLTEFLIENIC